jgi:hypothetical protein
MKLLDKCTSENTSHFPADMVGPMSLYGFSVCDHTPCVALTPDSVLACFCPRVGIMDGNTSTEPGSEPRGLGSQDSIFRFAFTARASTNLGMEESVSYQL